MIPSEPEGHNILNPDDAQRTYKALTMDRKDVKQLENIRYHMRLIIKEENERKTSFKNNSSDVDF